MAKHNDMGRMGEDFAARYLAQQGYDIMERDWQQGSRDLDIIARTPDGITVVFVEVKTRTSRALVRIMGVPESGRAASAAWSAWAYCPL